MFRHSWHLQGEVRIDSPKPALGKHPQQAIGGIEGRIRNISRHAELGDFTELQPARAR